MRKIELLAPAKDLAKALNDDKSLPASASKQAHIMIWVLRKMELIEETGIKRTDLTKEQKNIIYDIWKLK